MKKVTFLPFYFRFVWFSKPENVPQHKWSNSTAPPLDQPHKLHTIEQQKSRPLSKKSPQFHPLQPTNYYLTTNSPGNTASRFSLHTVHYTRFLNSFIHFKQQQLCEARRGAHCGPSSTWRHLSAERTVTSLRCSAAQQPVIESAREPHRSGTGRKDREGPGPQGTHPSVWGS